MNEPWTHSTSWMSTLREKAELKGSYQRIPLIWHSQKGKLQGKKTDEWFPETRNRGLTAKGTMR